MYYVQYFASVCAGLAVASTSVHVLWPSTALKSILAGNSPLEAALTEEQISWIVMSLFLGTIPGAMISGLMLEKFGRRKSLILLTAPLFLVWFPIGFTKSVLLLCLVRCIAGIAISAIIIVVTVYNAEIADKRIRGRLGTTLNAFSLLGEFIVACVGPFVSYKAFVLINCWLPLVSTILIFIIPESPYYLVKIGKKDEAEKQLKRLMGGAKCESHISNAMQDVENTIQLEIGNKSTMWGFLTEPMYRRSLIIILGIKFLQQLSGSSAFSEFTDKILQASRLSISQETWEIILTGIPLVGVFLSGLLVDKIGRKALLIISLVWCAVTLVAEGFCCMIQEHLEEDIHKVSWLATTSLILYSVARPLGIGTLPYVLMGELFATNIRHHAVAFCGMINAVTGFLMLKYFGQVSNVKGLFVTFWTFAGICVLGSLFVYFVIPETKCKTFREIQIELKAEETTTPTDLELH